MSDEATAVENIEQTLEPIDVPANKHHAPRVMTESVKVYDENTDSYYVTLRCRDCGNCSTQSCDRIRGRVYRCTGTNVIWGYYDNDR